jgi:hypothetical protein
MTKELKNKINKIYIWILAIITVGMFFYIGYVSVGLHNLIEAIIAVIICCIGVQIYLILCNLPEIISLMIEKLRGTKK